MATTRIKGYELTLKWGGKFIKGLETTGLKNKPNFEETLLKENGGNPVKEFTDYDATLSFSGKTIIRDGTESGTNEDFQTLRAAGAQGAQVAFIYGRFSTGAKRVSGVGKISDYKEDSDSTKNMANFSGTIKVQKKSVTFPTA
jgi:hypothetical protein